MIRMFRPMILATGLMVGLVVGCGKTDEKAPPASGNEQRVVVVGTNPDYPPMQFIDQKTGDMVGYEIDLMEEIAKAGGFTIKWKNIEWKGIFGALGAKDIDAIMSAATITEERGKTYDFSDPYYTISQRLVVQKKDAATITAIEQLADKKIGVQMNTTGAILVAEKYPNWERATYDNAPLAFADLANGSVFGFMVDEPVADEYSRANPQMADKFATLPFKFSEEHYGIVLRKGDAALLQKINAGLKAVKEAGVDIKLREKWIK